MAEQRPPAAPLTTVTRGTFPLVEQLTTWLNDHGVDTTPWGQGKAKRVEQLYKEIEAKVTHAPQLSLSLRARTLSRDAHRQFFCRRAPFSYWAARSFAV